MAEDFSEIMRQDLPRILEALRHIEERWPGRLSLSFHDRRSVYNYHPYLFREAFPGIEPRTLQDLSLAALLIAGAVCVRDGLLDGRAGADAPRAALRVQAMELEAYRAWARHLSPHARFWERYQALAAEYARVNLEAARFASGQRPWSAFDEGFATALARGNSALACSTVDALAELSGALEHHERLRSSIERYNVARQLWDDVCDWREDLLMRAPTLPIARVMAARPDLADHPRDEALLREVAREVHFRGHLRHVLGLALDHLAEAERLAAGPPALGWHRVLATLRESCEALRADLEAIVARNVRGAPTAPPPGAP